MTCRLINADVVDGLFTIEPGSIHSCVTSPPYWGLRDYGVEGQLGLEDNPQDYVDRIVDVFRYVRRVLRDDGTLWLNLGDTYTASGCGGDTGKSGLDRSTDSQDESKKAAQRRCTRGSWRRDRMPRQDVAHEAAPALQRKNLVGIPWRVAFALQEDGWYLRSDIIWHKPNPMPESVKDRPTKSHEYLFLLAKSAKYYYDSDAIAEPMTNPQDSTPEDLRRANNRRREVAPMPRQDKIPSGWDTGAGGHRDKVGRYPRDPGPREPRPGVDVRGGNQGTGQIPNISNMKNKRTVWKVATQPYKGAHFATFPEKLVTPCVLAGAPAGGVVLDPFAGSGTVGKVAEDNGRDSVLIEISTEYCELIRKRVGVTK